MSVNFYDDTGVMLAIDFHAYPTGGVTAPLPHLVSAPMSRIMATSWKRTSTVTSRTFPMIQKGHDLLFFEHLPLVPPAGNPPGIAADAVAIRLGASSKANFAVHKVTGEGEPLATCVDGSTGLNSNCTSPALPIGYVFQLNSVVTQPTLGDYVAWVAQLAVSDLISRTSSPGWSGGNPLPTRIGKVLTKLLPEILKEQRKAVPGLGVPADLPGEVGKTLGKLADLLVDPVDAEASW
jgi:hypothetical protein